VTTTVRVSVAEAFRNEWGRVVASLIRSFGDWDLAEEAAQEAFTRALEHWTRSGPPRSPGAWLMTTARNVAIDRLRRSARAPVASPEGGMDVEAEPPFDLQGSGIDDDRLRLIFTCCHPALSLEAQVALTLRTLVGLTTREIGRAMLVSEATMAKRLVRAKRKIAEAGIPYRVPSGAALPERTAAVLGVLYLLFNEGYGASSGSELVRSDLCAEAIRLARLLVMLMPDEAEARGVLALMLLHDARRHARTDGEGNLVSLEDQDRGLWDHVQIGEGCAILEVALRLGRPGPYQLQARIAQCHALAPDPAATDWASIAELYEQLAAVAGSPVVALNSAVAIGMRDGPLAGLRAIDEIPDLRLLADYHLLPAARADLLRRLGRHEEAAAAYREALELVSSEPEERYLRRRLLEVSKNI
jgi:RNA polymerase sigma-70 factor (ECF subfamily)